MELFKGLNIFSSFIMLLLSAALVFSLVGCDGESVSTVEAAGDTTASAVSEASKEAAQGTTEAAENTAEAVTEAVTIAETTAETTAEATAEATTAAVTEKTTAKTTEKNEAEEPAQPDQKAVVSVFTQNEVAGDLKSNEHIPKITLYGDGSCVFRCNLYYAMLNINGTWQKTEDGNVNTYKFSTDTYDSVPVGSFTLTYKNGSDKATFNAPSSAYFGLTVNGAVFDADAATVKASSAAVKEPQKLTNQEVHAKLEEYWNGRYNAGGNRYSYADITHDGIDEMFAICGDGYSGFFDVLTYDDGEINKLYSGENSTMTLGWYYYHLYVEGGKPYIMRAAFFERQGYPLHFYEIFSLDKNGGQLMLRESRYEGSREEDTEGKLDKIWEEYKIYRDKSDVIITVSGTDIVLGQW